MLHLSDHREEEDPRAYLPTRWQTAAWLNLRRPWESRGIQACGMHWRHRREGRRRSPGSWAAGQTCWHRPFHLCCSVWVDQWIANRSSASPRQLGRGREDRGLRLDWIRLARLDSPRSMFGIQLDSTGSMFGIRLDSTRSMFGIRTSARRNSRIADRERGGRGGERWREMERDEERESARARRRERERCKDRERERSARKAGALEC